MQRFRGGFEFKAYRLCVSLNVEPESDEEESEEQIQSTAPGRPGVVKSLISTNLITEKVF